MTSGPTPSELADLARNLQMLLLDVDGVMTDGGIILIGDGSEGKRFDVQDGVGIALARAAGLKVGIITSRDSEVVKRRARELAIEDVFQGIRRKVEVFPVLLQRYNIDASQTAYIGDDIQDLPVMRRVGIPIAVRNAVPEVKSASVYTTAASGGYGAVREAVEWLLKLRGQLEQACESIIG